MSQARSTPTERLITAPVAAIVASGLNPRIINAKAPDFVEFVASVKAAGVVIPVHVRTNPEAANGRTPYLYELLAGERRWRAAQAVGVETIRAIDHGALDDAAAFEITFIENYQRRDLTPMEAGKGVAILLERFSGDVKAAAAKLGHTERWVQLHAQIERGLSADWKAAAQTERFREWSAAHWVLIARLPAVFQANALKSLGGNAGWACGRWPSDQLEEHLVSDRLLLAKAPFETGGCAECLKRTGVQPLLWGDEPAELEGANDRCLDRACWRRKEAKAVKADLAETAKARGVPGAVPISMVERKAGYDPDYAERIGAAKRAFGKALVTAERIEPCKKTDKGAVPALVVAGRGKGSLKWVRIVEPKTDKYGRTVAKPPTAAELARQKREEENVARKVAVIREIAAEIVKAKRPAFEDLLFCCSVTEWPRVDDYSAGWPKRVAAISKAREEGRLRESLAADCEASLVDWLKHLRHYLDVRRHWPAIAAIAPVFGLDADRRLAERAKADAAKDKAAEAKTSTRAKRPGKAGRK